MATGRVGASGVCRVRHPGGFRERSECLFGFGRVYLAGFAWSGARGGARD